MAKRLIYFVLAIALLVGLLPGCGDGTSGLYGDVLYLADTEPYKLDPATAGDATSNTYITHIFSGLVKLDDDMEPVADIAESWDISLDGTVYTFYLRQDVEFNNGDPVTAADFKYSWERAADPAIGSTTAATYLGDIVGVTEKLAGEATEISGIRVIDDYTLEVAIDKPKSYFLAKLTYVTAYVVNQENVESADNWWLNPVGTGPFNLNNWEDGAYILLQRNDNYYGTLAGLDFAVFYFNKGRPLELYETGQIDVASVNTAYIDKVMDEKGVFYEALMVVPQLSFYYVGFNCDEPPFDDPNIRLAFSMAIDKEKIVSLAYKNTVETADGILPPGMPGYDDEVVGIPFDVEMAKQLIGESSYGDVSNLPEIAITVIGWGGMIPTELEAIVNEWRVNLGVEVTVRQLEPEEFLYDLSEVKDEMYYTGWIADYSHPQNFLEVLFATGADNNHGEYSDILVDALLETAASETDPEKALELYGLVERLLVADAACIPFWFGQAYVLVKPYVEGFRISPLGLPDLSGVTLNK